MGIRATRIGYTVLLLSMCVIVVGCGQINKEIIDRATPEKETVEWGPWTEVDLNRICDYYAGNSDCFFWWVWSNIGYQEDTNGELNTPLKVLNARKGSCVGHSLLFEYYFKRQGIECVVVDIYGDGYAHCGCIVPSEMTWYSAQQRISIDLPYCDIPKVAVFVGDKLGKMIVGYGYYEDKEYIRL